MCIRIIENGYLLFPAGKPGVDSPYNLSQLPDKRTTGGNNLFPVFYQLFIPNVQCWFLFRFKGQFLKETVPLQENPVILNQRMDVELIQLTQFHINKTAPLRGTILYDV